MTHWTKALARHNPIFRQHMKVGKARLYQQALEESTKKAQTQKGTDHVCKNCGCILGRAHDTCDNCHIDGMVTKVNRAAELASNGFNEAAREDQNLGTGDDTNTPLPQTDTPAGFKVGSGAVIAGMDLGSGKDETVVTYQDQTEVYDLDCNITMDFIKAGKAIFTVDNGKGTHYTYKVTRKEDKDKVFYFVNLLTGPDNTSNYTYMGMLVDSSQWHRSNMAQPSSWYCKMTRASKFKNDSQSVKVLNWALMVVQGYKELPEGYSILHDGRCGRCGRLLTDPDSIKLGLGPICRDQGY